MSQRRPSGPALTSKGRRCQLGLCSRDGVIVLGEGDFGEHEATLCQIGTETSSFEPLHCLLGGFSRLREQVCRHQYLASVDVL
jgi:hypothetical protein